MPDLFIRTATTRDVDDVLALWRAAGAVPTVSDARDALVRLGPQKS